MIDHVQLAMPIGGEDAARDFYGAILGMNEVPKPQVLAARGGVWFESGGVQLHLGVEEDFAPARKAHPALRVTDLASIQSRLKAHGCEVRNGEPLEGRNRIYASDPFGNRLEFTEHGTP